jgi:hypothetical protein
MAAPFKGEIALDVRDSTPDWDPFIPPRAPGGSPNVLIVLYDDTGLAAGSTHPGGRRCPRRAACRFALGQDPAALSRAPSASTCGRAVTRALQP